MQVREDEVFQTGSCSRVSNNLSLSGLVTLAIRSKLCRIEVWVGRDRASRRRTLSSLSWHLITNHGGRVICSSGEANPRERWRERRWLYLSKFSLNGFRVAASQLQIGQDWMLKASLCKMLCTQRCFPSDSKIQDTNYPVRNLPALASRPYWLEFWRDGKSDHFTWTDLHSVCSIPLRRYELCLQPICLLNEHACM